MSSFKNLANESALISQKTIAHYDQNAFSYYEGTKDHDVSQNIDALLRAIKTEPPFHILDFGCGPGRDLQTFTKLGHVAIGLEGSQQAAQIARTKSGCEILVQDFFNLSLPDNTFDGIFANASLFHIPNKLLPMVLSNLWACLKPNGILFSSNPRGNNEESWYGDRFASYHDLATWRSFMTNAQFTEIEHFYRPSGLPIEQQPWLASVWKK
ncbi:bifunctional 2-polyprenyl-6-hydroxyphenol methylase/3-demethylubiquinol 3-O-methyltransferase UbiG [Polynucleobacter sp. AP-Sving-400A-A2]|uniref:class I SAM-dependent methyltransferase n=1 Tax=Polynucleobacter sp. AP-Sving-400A-A2 TaxID=2081049 RepID=UPI001BFD6EFB|nr:class I SAM-dependent methyltransferase [Polynucleobacter sp. AP-Sving-400A-A2]QWE14236.1 class I SAM-dependent methyltransferase [Polynucleobacter sp. AP-Sving-400A-A2]